MTLEDCKAYPALSPSDRAPSADATRPRRRGNPAMRKGAPSLNPHGRPPVGLSLAAAIRKRFPAERLVELADAILAGDAPAAVKLRTLQWLDRRGYRGVRPGAEVAPCASPSPATPAGGG
jgi:hypothetical protein